MFQADHPKYHAETRAFVALIQKNKVKPYWECSIEEARELSRKRVLQCAGEFQFDGIKSELFIPSPDVKEGIPVYIYKPSTLTSDPPILVFYHGGGWVIGGRQHYDVICKKLSTTSGCIIVNVEYRLSPEHKFPAFIDDGLVALKWTLDYKQLIGGSSSSCVGVGGDSAGGTIAASVAHQVQVDFQVLIYPRCYPDLDSGSFKEFHTAPGLPVQAVEWFESMCVQSSADSHDPRFRVGLNTTFPLDPPTLFIIAECDPLCDDGLAYKKKLDEANVETELCFMKGACHAYWNLAGVFTECCAQSDAAAAEFIKRQGKKKTCT